MELLSKLKGTGVAIVTPFRKDSSIDFLSLEKLLKHVLDNGVDYLVVLGTTGESATLNKEEKKALLNFVIEFTNGKVPVVAGFGGNNTNEIVSSIKSYDFKGIDAILSVAPAYNKPTQEGIYQHYKAISAVSPRPIILYNVPGRTSVNMTAETTLRLANDFDNIVAMKEASGCFEQIMTIIKNKPENFVVLSGDDMLTLPLISIGVEGVISVIANALPSEFSSLVNAALEGNFKEANTYQQKMLKIMNYLFIEGNPAGVKEALKVQGVIENYLRLPLVPVSKTTNKLIADQVALIKG